MLYSTYRSYESIQKRFLRFALIHLPWDNSIILPSYRERVNLIILNTLIKRKEVADLLFPHGLPNTIHSPLISLNDIFYVKKTNTNYGKHTPVSLMFLTCLYQSLVSNY